eukprot:CAMPEP_0198133972 /NCGR_PEP_ID=MMETSP1442-20131203/59842_1 /TAXON_ID= /ORGANISM="Craspedostauros australis, Strain CCMP3328" /LENGTH=378 /DNA_ID=CAMNT_0043795107 /DNA_START=575 /DNA_END=1711 /DNA_ORIENTATION=+
METDKNISSEKQGQIDEALNDAIRRDDTDLLQRLIATPWLDVDMNRRLSDGRTWLHIAATSGSDEVVEFLLSSKAANVDLTVQDARGRTPLHAVCAEGQFRRVEQIMSSGNKTLDVTIKDEDGNTPFHIVCGCTKGNHVLIWVGEGGELKRHDINARVEMVGSLSKCHAHILNPTIQNNAGDTGYHIACRANMLVGVVSEAILTLIMDHLRKEVIPNYNLDQLTVIKNGDAIDRLIKLCQHPFNIQNNDDLDQLTVIKNGDAIDRLIKLCQHPFNIQNNDGDTPLHMENISKHGKVFGGVLDSVIFDTTLQNKHGDTALHNLCKVGGIAMLKLILESELCKTDLSIQNLKGQTPLDIAVANGHDNCVTYLTEALRKVT